MSETGKNKRGFSLIEIMVVLLLVGVFTAIAIPTFRSINGSKLKSTANQLQGLIRDTYARASLSGKTCRIVFDMDKKEYWIEESADTVKVKNKEQDEDAKRDRERDPEVAKLAKPPEFKAVEDELGEKQKLPEDIYFRSIWIDRFEERANKGQIALYFFPDGYTEEAQIIIADDPEGKRLYNLVVEPLTGAVVIEDQELPIEKQ
ncbi:MAG: prepilin-type N-terminal cleavage/methylation domain-containing protein [Myxococcaceae bacterium]